MYMKEFVINSSLNLIKKECPHYNEEKLEEIEYGLVSIYLTITKTIVIVTVAIILGILKEMIVFTVIYNIIRMPSFGLHATKSWICLLSSATIFLLMPYVCAIVQIPILSKVIVGVIGILLMFKNSPADTEKKPIVSPQRRKVYKIVSTLIAIIYVVLAVILPNNFLSNSFIAALILQCFIISPAVYKLFGLPYDNYKNYTA